MSVRTPKTLLKNKKILCGLTLSQIYIYIYICLFRTRSTLKKEKYK